MVTKADALVYLIEKGPGRTEAELARAIYGKRGTQQYVNSYCSMLDDRGIVERRGSGGPADPFKYYAV